nr:hypothetical protein [Gammaproteobacteria bacterium]
DIFLNALAGKLGKNDKDKAAFKTQAEALLKQAVIDGANAKNSADAPPERTETPREPTRRERERAERAANHQTEVGEIVEDEPSKEATKELTEQINNLTAITIRNEMNKSSPNFTALNAYATKGRNAFSKMRAAVFASIPAIFRPNPKPTEDYNSLSTYIGRSVIDASRSFTASNPIKGSKDQKMKNVGPAQMLTEVSNAVEGKAPDYTQTQQDMKKKILGDRVTAKKSRAQDSTEEQEEQRRRDIDNVTF